MTSLDASPQSARALTVTQDKLRIALERKFRTTTAPGFPARLIAHDAEAAADAAMAVFGPVLEARDGEIARLREQAAERTLAVIDELRDAAPR